LQRNERNELRKDEAYTYYCILAVPCHHQSR
jgi:hypothetical protein